MAIAMQRKGLNVTVYESAVKFKTVGAGITLASNAMKAFTEIGIAEDIMKAGKEIKAMAIKDDKGKVISFTDAEKLTADFGVVNNFTIHRAELHDVLAGLLIPGTIEFGKTCSDVIQHGRGVTIHFGDGSEAQAEYVIASDGIHSPIRRKLLPESSPRFSGYTCWRAVVSDLPEDFNSSEASESWGPGKRFGIVPLSNNRVYWFATLNARANDPIMRNASSEDLLHYFKDFHFPIPEILERTRDEQIIWSDIIDLKPIRKFAFERIVLMGDAAHATTPNMGQGACMAIEDAATLANGLMKYSPEETFIKFEASRIRRTTEIVKQSWNIGKIAQLENSLVISLRNGLFRKIPKSVIDKQMKSLYNVSFQL